MAKNDYGPKTGAADDHPYNAPDQARQAPAVPDRKSASTPPDAHTVIDSEADIGDPSDS